MKAKGNHGGSKDLRAKSSCGQLSLQKKRWVANLPWGVTGDPEMLQKPRDYHPLPLPAPAGISFTAFTLGEGPDRPWSSRVCELLRPSRVILLPPTNTGALHPCLSYQTVAFLLCAICLIFLAPFLPGLPLTSLPFTSLWFTGNLTTL